MKFLRLILFVAVLFAGSKLFAQTSQTKSDTLKVAGECGMCKNRIQKSLKIEGVNSASWDSESRLLTVTYDPVIITNDDIQKIIAAAGHDTEKYKAPDAIYAKLPGCCRYDRMQVKSSEKN